MTFLPDAAAARADCSGPERWGQNEEQDDDGQPLAAAPMQLAWPAALMTAAEVAAVLRITPKTVRQHIRRGSLRALRIDGTGPYRVRAEDAQRWAERQAAVAVGGTQAVDRYALARASDLPSANARRRRRAGVSA